MNKSENILNELKEIAPTLSGMKKGNPFYTSDAYFDALSSNIQQKISSNKNERKNLHMLSFLQKPQYAVAASLVVIFIISIVYFNQPKTNHALAQSNTIYWDEILNESNSTIDKMDEALLVETLANEMTTNHINMAANQPLQTTIDEVSEEVESAYNNDVFNEL
ncbi:MAG: hypothetical protein WCO13_11605 [Bacteroidota bacterium]